MINISLTPYTFLFINKGITFILFFSLPYSVTCKEHMYKNTHTITHKNAYIKYTCTHVLFIYFFVYFILMYIGIRMLTYTCIHSRKPLKQKFLSVSFYILNHCWLPMWAVSLRIFRLLSVFNLCILCFRISSENYWIFAIISTVVNN